MRLSDDQAVLGVCLQQPERRWQVAHIEPRHFDQAWHSKVWNLLRDMADEDEEAGVSRPIREDRLLTAAPELSSSSKAIVAAKHLGDRPDVHREFDACADRLVTRWQSRRLKRAAEEVIVAFEQGEYEGDPRAAVERQAAIWAAAEHEVAGSDSASSVYSPDELGQMSLDVLRARKERPDEVRGLESGWSYWDRMHKNARAGRVGFTIAPTGVGKTSFMLNLGHRVCFNAAGLYVNLEMPDDDIVLRSTSAKLGGLCLDNLDTGDFAHGILADLAAAPHKLSITPASEKTAGAICSLLARHAIRDGMQWACIDHLLEVTMSPEEESRSRGMQWHHHAGWVKRWAGLARRYGFALEVVGQCGTSDLVFDAGHEPQLRNMQGSRAVLNYVDVARVLWRDEDCHKVSVSKNRGGKAPFVVPFNFTPTQGYWREMR